MGTNGVHHWAQAGAADTRQDFFESLIRSVVSEPDHFDSHRAQDVDERVLLYGFVDLVSLWAQSARATARALGLTSEIDSRVRVDFRALAGIASTQEQRTTQAQCLWAEGWYFTSPDPNVAPLILLPPDSPIDRYDAPDEWWKTYVPRYEADGRGAALGLSLAKASVSVHLPILNTVGSTKLDSQLISRATALAMEIMEVAEPGVKSVIVIFSGDGELSGIVKTALAHRTRRAQRFSLDEDTIPFPHFVFIAPRGFMSKELTEISELYPTVCKVRELDLCLEGEQDLPPLSLPHPRLPPTTLAHLPSGRTALLRRLRIPPAADSLPTLDALAVDLSRRCGVVTSWCAVLNESTSTERGGGGGDVWDLAFVFGLGGVGEWDKCREGVRIVVADPLSCLAEEAGEVVGGGAVPCASHARAKASPSSKSKGPKDVKEITATVPVAHSDSTDQATPPNTPRTQPNSATIRAQDSKPAETSELTKTKRDESSQSAPLWMTSTRSPTPEPEGEFVTITRRRASSPPKWQSSTPPGRSAVPKVASGPRRAGAAGLDIPPSRQGKTCPNSYACTKGLECTVLHTPEEQRFFAMLKKLNAKLPGSRYKQILCRSWNEGVKCRNLDGERPGNTMMCSWAHGSTDYWCSFCHNLGHKAETCRKYRTKG
ncbi:hypothetical protein M427DRAFT_195930 [Gonapodya prolifera JEL478]|uniref:Uncharacterized protein n=1 Tax=Gonapodya prolifera (strain JEL478) TaxID=1344416 RepID=A0A139APG6_GONPJ|nr:hypothetical protein M427DRAFT_195930 [Gonapodya prolifera JEL478]|eukprot:KXS18618.1 hypothetical protein M427DRAFT_195930 [Gonapodya prolifera JEL478]